MTPWKLDLAEAVVVAAILWLGVFGLFTYVYPMLDEAGACVAPASVEGERAFVEVRP